MAEQLSRKLFGTAAMAVVLGMGTASAYAEDSSCACISAADGATVSATQVSGSVLVAADGGYVPLETGTALPADARVLSGPDAGAVISYGEACTIELAANSRVYTVEEDGQTCIKVEAIFDGTTPYVSTQGTEMGAVLPAVVGAGAVGVAAIGLGLGSSSSSP